MICARCHKPIESGDLYQQVKRRMTLPPEGRAMDPIVDVHVTCPPDMPTLPTDFLDMIACLDCGHAASRHQMAVDGDSIVVLAAHMFCDKCGCHGFTTGAGRR